MQSGFEEGSYLRLVDFCVTRIQAESNEEEEEGTPVPGRAERTRPLERRLRNLATQLFAGCLAGKVDLTQQENQ